MEIKTSKLIKRFLEETNYNQNKDVILIMAYGSRIMDNASSSSDLDILIVTSRTISYRGARMIDGIPIDIMISSINDVEQDIKLANCTGSSYLESVLKSGKVIYDKYDTYNNLCNLLEYQVNKKRILSSELLELATNYVSKFIFHEDDKDVNYFTALELLRRLYHAKKNCSNIHLLKVYKLYMDRNLSKEKYKIKLPDEEFIQEYLKALEETDRNKQKDYLLKFLKEFEKIKINSGSSTTFLNDLEITRKLIALNNTVLKCEDMLLYNHPYANALYYIVIGQLANFYQQVYKDISDEFKQIYKDAIKTKDTESRIIFLEKLFCLTDSQYRIDYNDFTIRM